MDTEVGTYGIVNDSINNTKDSIEQTDPNIQRSYKPCGNGRKADFSVRHLERDAQISVAYCLLLFALTGNWERISR